MYNTEQARVEAHEKAAVDIILYYTIILIKGGF